MKKSLFLLLLLLFTSKILYSQPCDFPPVGLDCESAPFLCDLDLLNGYCTTTPTFPNPTGPSPLCNGQGVPNNTVFLGFIASTAYIDLNILASNCSSVGGQMGIQGGIYKGDCTFLEPIVCEGICQLSVINLSSGQFVPGEKYWLLIDGCNNSSCDISIELNAGMGGSPLGNISNIDGPKKTCNQQAVEYSIKPVDNATYYYWSLNGTIFGNPEIEDEKITLNFGTPGVYQLCVDVANYCTPVTELPNGKCIDIVVTESYMTTLPPVQICARDTYYYDGKPYPVGVHTIKYNTGTGCDSLIKLTIDSFPIPVTKLGTKFICKGECISIKDTFGNGADICDTEINKDVYLQSWQGCDSIVNISVRKIDLDPGILPGFITCKDTNVTLISNLNPSNVDSFKLEWTSLNGNIISDINKESIIVNVPGDYCLNMILYGNNGSICYDTLCTTVTYDTLAPTIDYYFSGDSLLKCGNKPVTVGAITNSIYFGPHWTYNNSFITGDSIKIYEPGELSLYIIDKNGCSSDTLLIDIKATYKFKDTITIDSSLCFGESILIDSIVYYPPNNINQFNQINDSCHYTHYILSLKNYADTVLYKCDNDTLDLFGFIIPADSINFYLHIPNTTLCDSVWHIKVIKFNSSFLTYNVNIPKGAVYHGVLIKKDTIIFEYYKNVAGCDSIVTIYVKTPVSTSNINNEIEITLVPNPAKDQITLYSKYLGETKNIELYNSLGQKLMSDNEILHYPYNMDIAHLSNGMYWIRVNTDKGYYIISFIKAE